MAIRRLLNTSGRRAIAPVAVGALALVAAAVYGAPHLPVTASPWAVTPIEDQSFEGTFPPAKWQVGDIGSPPGQFVWAKTTCTAAPGGGSASVWSIGGGSLGGGLGCGGTYNAWSESDLIYGPIDATGFDGGIDVGLHMKLDLQRDNDFQVCATDPGAENGLSCFIVGAGVTQMDWNYFEPPITFSGTAGLTNMYVIIRFRDREPDTGSPHQGAWVDRVTIRGLSGGAGPSPTPPPTTAVPSATAAPSATTAAPTATQGASPAPSATPSTTPMPSGTATPSPSGTATPSPSPSSSAQPATAAPTHSPTPVETIAPSTTPGATDTPVPGATTPAPSATVTLPPPPPTIEGSVTAVSSPTLVSTPSTPATPTTPGPGTATPDGPTPTVMVVPQDWFLYLPFGVVSRAR